MKNTQYLLPILIFAILLIAYAPLLGWFFARDDFGFLPHLPTTIQNLPAILIPPQNWFFRPLSQQFYFWLNSQIWGLNPLGFRLGGLSLLTLNTFLTYRLIRRFSDQKVAVIGSIFYGLNTLHLFEIGWISAHYQTISTLFFLSTILLATSQRRSCRVFSFLTLIAAFLTSEMSVFITPILVIYKIIYDDKYFKFHCQRPVVPLRATISNFKLSLLIRSTLPYVVLSIIYIIFYLSYVHLPGGSVYGRFLDPTAVVKTLGKYLLYPFVAGFGRDNFFGITNTLLAIRSLIIFVIAVYSIVTKTGNKKLVIIGAAWFLVSVSVFTVLSNHTFAYLDAIPSIGLTLIVAASWSGLARKSHLYPIALTLLFLTSFGSLVAAQKSDPDLKWLSDHQQAAKGYLLTFRVPENKEVVLNQNDYQLMEATYYGNSLKAFFKDQNLAITLTATQ